ncbi:GAF domain-containing protein [Streptomyces uncialis]|uniref:GAF domain-containing protein n=1 Tax=Streptomyces uncialis TaxID=1048205 RepID=UPI00382E13C3
MTAFAHPDEGSRPRPDRATPATPAQRARRLAELGLALAPSGTLDALATELADAADTPYSMVNWISDGQYFAGLHTPDGRSDLPAVGRKMSLDHGYCPELLHRTKPLVLPDVCSSSRFSGNPVVDMIGIRSYTGAPLVDPETGIVFGTICAVGTEPRPGHTGRHSLHLIKTFRDRLWDILHTTPRPPLTPPRHHTSPPPPEPHKTAPALPAAPDTQERDR